MAAATQPTHKKERGPHLGKGADQGPSRFLDAEKRSATACQFEHAMREKIVGQDEAVQALVDIYQVFCAGLHSPGRPVGNLLFLGPTGSGKTRTVEAAAEILFGDSRAVIKVDCAEFQHSHEIAKLIGSPPGYLGHRESHPLITQEAVAVIHGDHMKLSFLLFDEIEKASDALWQLLLGMLDKATLTLGDNRKVDLSDRDLPDLEPRGQPDRRADARGYGVHPAEGQGDNRITGEGAEDRCRGGEAEVLARVHESLGQSRGVPSPEA